MKKIICATAMIMALLVLTACGSKESSSSGDSSGSSGAASSGSSSGSSGGDSSKTVTSTDDGSETFTYDWLIGHWATPPDPDGLITKAIEEKWNVKLNMQWMPNGALKEKINLLVNSGDYPDICTLPKTWIAPSTPPEYEVWANEELFVDLKPYLELHGPSVLEQIPQRQFEIGPGLLNGEVSGAYYAIPNVTWENNMIMILRDDWLQNLGLDVPHTLDEWYNVWQAFTYDDPDRNGIDDTYGYFLSNDDGWATIPILGAFDLLIGYPYLDNDGNFVPYYLTDRYFESLAFINNMWNEGLIDPASISLSGNNVASERFDGGKLGSFIIGSNNVIWRLGFVKNAFPETELITATLPAGSDGQVRMTEGYAFHRDTAVFYQVEEEYPAKVERFIKMWDWLVQGEGQDLLTWGVEGVHYNMVDGKRIATPEWETHNMNNYRIPFTQDPLDLNLIPRYRDNPEYATMQTEAYEEVREYIITNPIISLPKTEAELNQLECFTYKTESLYNMMTGKTPINNATIAEFKANWLKKGGQQHLDEWQALVEEKRNTPAMQEWLSTLESLQQNW